MNKLLVFAFTVISCGQTSENTESSKILEDSTSLQIETVKTIFEQNKPIESRSIDQKPYRKEIALTQPTVVVIQMDFSEIERLKEVDGEDNFYTAADDLMWYNAKLIEKMDSLKIPLIYSKQDTLYISTPNSNYDITKDTSFSLYTYFFFDGDTFARKELFELLSL